MCLDVWQLKRLYHCEPIYVKQGVRKYYYATMIVMWVWVPARGCVCIYVLECLGMCLCVCMNVRVCVFTIDI